MMKTIYELTIADIQDVANKEIGRELSPEEVNLLQNRIAEKIPWYDIIAQSIDELALV